MIGHAGKIVTLLAVLFFLCVHLSGQKAQLVIQSGHTSDVKSVIVSPDGRLLASIDLGSTVVLWDTRTGKQLRSLIGNTDRIGSIAFSPNGRVVAAGGTGFDPTIRFWDVLTGEQIGIIDTKEQQTTQAIAFSPDGRYVASGSYDGSLKIWDLKTGKLARQLEGHKNQVSSMVFSPDGNVLASSSFDKTAVLWKVATGERLATLPGHDGWVTAIVFSKGGDRIFTAGWDGTIKLWNARDGTQRTFALGVGPITALALSPDDVTLACPGTEGIVLLETTSGETRSIAKIEHTVGTVAFFSDGQSVVEGRSESPVIHRWDARTGALLQRFAGSGVTASGVIMSPTGKHFATYGAIGEVRLWDIDAQLANRTLTGNREGIMSAAYSASGDLLATADIEGHIVIHDTESGEVVKDIDAGRDWYHHLAFSPDSRFIAASSRIHEEIDLWDVAAGVKLKSLGKHGDDTTGNVPSGGAVAFTPDGKLLIAGANDATLKLWNVATGRQVGTLRGHRGSVSCVAISPDGRRIASGGGDGNAILWDLKTGRLIAKFMGHSSTVLSIAFTPDRNTIVTGGRDGLIVYWDVRRGKPKKVLADLESAIWSVALSRNGDLVLAGTTEGKIQVWAARKPEPVATIVALAENDWVVTDGTGRFDTNKELDRMEGVHWVISDDPLTPKPLELFLRQYYEPGLLGRLLKCHVDSTCDKEFKPLPPIAEINRVQPTASLAPVTQRP